MALLGRPEAAGVQLELETCERLGVSPSQFGGRPTVTTYLYDDEGQLLRTVTSSPWTAEDHALMIAWRLYRSSLHEPCGYPLAIATHPFMEGWFEQKDDLICWACTAAQEPGEDGTRKPVKVPLIVDTHDHVADPLPPVPTTPI